MISYIMRGMENILDLLNNDRTIQQYEAEALDGSAPGERILALM